jgi:hypothetical protein
VDESSSEKDKLVAVTPESNHTGNYAVRLEFYDGNFIDTGLKFEYRPNPILQDIQPRSHLIIGGTQVDISGEYIDSVPDPNITLTVLESRSTLNNVVRRQNTEPCSVVNSRRMTCRMPIVELSDVFKTQLENTSGQISDTDGPGVAAYVKDNSTDRVDLYIGLGLDNYGRYKNISQTNSSIKMQFFLNPIVSCNQDSKDVDPKENPYYEIQGEYIIRGSRKVDVEIQIGDGDCDVEHVTDNAIKCRLPDKKPNKGDSSALCDGSERAAELFIGNAQYHCNCLQYPDSTNWKLIVGLVVGLGGAFLLALVVVVVVVVVVRRRRRKLDNSSHATVGSNTNYSRQVPGGEEISMADNKYDGNE